MTRCRVFCFFLVLLTAGTSAIGQVVFCPAKCNNLASQKDAWNDASGNCYVYGDVYGEVMKTTNLDAGPVTTQTTDIARVQYDACSYICTRATNPQIMTKGGEVLVQKSVAWNKCVPIASLGPPMPPAP